MIFLQEIPSRIANSKICSQHGLKIRRRPCRKASDCIFNYLEVLSTPASSIFHKALVCLGYSARPTDLPLRHICEIRSPLIFPPRSSVLAGSGCDEHARSTGSLGPPVRKRRRPARNSVLVFPWSGCQGVCVFMNTEMCKNSIYSFVLFLF